MQQDSSSYETLSWQVAQSISELIKKKPNACLALPAGRTPLGFYQILAQWSVMGNLDWTQVRCFGLDEYLDVNPKHSFKHYLQTNFYRHTNLRNSNCFNPSQTDNYDALIAQEGGLDISILGLGANGHIAFNEPGTPMQSWTQCIFLSPATRNSNAVFFDLPDQIPTKAITMGISTILKSNVIFLVVSGPNKKIVLEQALKGKITPELPASFLQQHPNLHVFTDFIFD